MGSPNKASAAGGGDDSPSPSPSLRTSSLLRRVGSVRAHRNDLSERLGLLRMMNSSSVRRRSKSNPQVASPPTTPRFLVQEPPSHRKGLPAWDRAFDAVYHSNSSYTPSFSDTLTSFFEDHGRSRPDSGYFRLPDDIRLRICNLILPIVDRPVRLDRLFFTRDVWREGDLAAPTDALLPLAPYLQVSFAFRADFLVAFLQSVTLHAVFSPFVGYRVNPLATTWLNRYGPYARSIAVEVDMSRLGCGPADSATCLLPDVEHVEDLVCEFVDSQLRRKESLPLQSLILLCRRFYGRRDPSLSRPDTGRSSGASSSSRANSAEDMRFQSPEMYASMDELMKQMTEETVSSPFETPMPSPLPQSEYCPDSYLLFCNHIVHLKGRINSLRMCGFDETYTTRFMATLFSDASSGQAYRVAPSTIWPRLSGQKSCLDAGDGYTILDDHQVQSALNAPVAHRPWEGCVQLPPPIPDEEGNQSLPSIVGDLQRLRSPYARTVTSLSERTCDQMLKETGGLGNGSDKNRFLRFMKKYGKKKKKQRTLTREASATL
ncbi:hypothetical protein NCS57_01107000 [Fusarium keratoplasticum]|uniref:Uncharacterized protein n=1 Tax=Fusarium keratoplasticum TaxID=1328300 RepID=A0ACC0QJ07_9HYPO|nr:hypothetical protein NCS57_01107000 [Fusarium keratoplasticum]KAI8657290.1 hypothetical protein NCS57_01107000 [Fusarium keratoplasticum]KAI8658265.1 hypothetical protein NCS55_01101900 [Fusarium keratoplasticum]